MGLGSSRFKGYGTLDSPEHRKTGIDAGADAYVGKGDFNSTILVDTIEELLTARAAG